MRESGRPLRVIHILLALGVLGLVAPAGAADEAEDAPKPSGDMKPLELKFPKPMFVGTPKNIKSPNLERPKTTRKPVLVPAGVVNLAAEKEVTASDEEPVIGEVELLTDGDKEGADGSYVEFGPGLQHVTIDLGKKSEIWAIAIWHYHSQGRVYYDTVVKVADDADFITGVQQVFNNDHDNSAGLGVGKDKEYIETNKGRIVGVDGSKVQARFVRLYSNGNTTNDLNHYIEVEVYGKPAE